MKTKNLTFLLALTFLFLFSGSSVVFGDDLQDGLAAMHGKDYKTAYKLLAPLAEQGVADAQNVLGFMYSKGKGVPQDYKEALKWTRLSAEQGFAKAQHYLGEIYDRGQGVPQNYKEAVKWYRLSAEQGDAFAQHDLGKMYSEGKGVLQDYVLAHMWFNLSSSQGMTTAIKVKNIVEKKMTPRQIEKAQEMARNWKPTSR